MAKIILSLVNLWAVGDFVAATCLGKILCGFTTSTITFRSKDTKANSRYGASVGNRWSGIFAPF